jgi:hypothetical protein
LRENTDRE